MLRDKYGEHIFAYLVFLNHQVGEEEESQRMEMQQFLLVATTTKRLASHSAMNNIAAINALPDCLDCETAPQSSSGKRDLSDS